MKKEKTRLGERRKHEINISKQRTGYKENRENFEQIEKQTEQV